MSGTVSGISFSTSSSGRIVQLKILIAVGGQ